MITAIEARGMVAMAEGRLREVAAMVEVVDRAIHGEADQGKTTLACKLREELPMVSRTMLVEEITRHGFVVLLEGKKISVSWAPKTEGGPRA